jgi:hypothetical protein
VRDENEAIDKSNIIEGERTRGAKPSGGYRDGTSQGGQ